MSVGVEATGLGRRGLLIPPIVARGTRALEYTGTGKYCVSRRPETTALSSWGYVVLLDYVLRM